MSNLCVVGLQWGDEGKGKIVDRLAADFDIVARYQGGSNAGHTVMVGSERFVLHLIPSGILRGKDCVIGNGVAVDPVLLVKEMNDLAARGVEVAGKIHLSDRAHVVMPYHKVLDGLDGTNGTGPRIGTTGKGIGPCYADKMARLGIRVAELYAPERFREHLRQNVALKNRLLTQLLGAEPLGWEAILEQYTEVARRLAPCVCDTALFLRDAMARGKRILFEGAQGALLDVDFGTYPYVTCSNPGPSGIVAGLGVPPRAVGRVAGIMKAYVTRVGEGPFPTQADPEADARLRERGGEYGATTGRPRRCGWFDAVAAKHACRLNGVDTIALMKLDVLAGEKEVKVCTAYRLNGSVSDVFPAEADALEQCQPVYTRFAGWPQEVSEARAFEDLPPTARDYVEALEGMVGTPIGAISLSPERGRLIVRDAWNE